MAYEFADEQAQRAARTYSAAADHYLLPALGFWDRFGAETVARLALAPGEAALDLCCGAGASAIPAARAVGPAGTVLGVDLAAPLLAAGRARADAERLRNIELRQADARSTGLPSGAFDAVTCVFGVFFASDMERFTAEMWRLVRPGGRLALTTWGPGLFEPANDAFWKAVRELEPGLYKAFNPWDEITTPAALTGLFVRSGTAPPAVEAVEGEHRLSEPDDFWDVVLGSGYRATVDALAPGQREELRTRLVDRLRELDVRTLRTDVVYGVAQRPKAG
jgi:ubiquinone/menaquinone biosynthesis C-methylase UbiE